MSVGHRADTIDWDKLVPLDEDQVEVYLALQGSSGSVANILGFAQPPPKSADEARSFLFTSETVKEALEKVAASKVVPDALPTTDPLVMHAVKLQAGHADCNELVKELDYALEQISLLYRMHEDRKRVANLVHEATYRLYNEKRSIETVITEIEAHLARFSFLDELAEYVNAPRDEIQSPLAISPNFSSYLWRTDECLEFLEKNPHFTDAALYHGRYRQCMTKALISSRNYCIRRIRELTARARHTLHSEISAMSNHGGAFSEDTMIALLATVQTSPVSLQFRDLCISLAPHVREIETRCPGHPEYHALRSECVQAFISARRDIGGAVISIIVKEFSKQDGKLLDQISTAISCLLALIHEERTLFATMFAHEYQSEISPLLEALSAPVYDLFRPRILGEANTKILGEVCELLIAKEEEEAEEEDEQATLNDDYSNLGTMLSDAQGRLVFRAQQQVQQLQRVMEDNREAIPALIVDQCELLSLLNRAVPRSAFRAFALEVFPHILHQIMSFVPRVPSGSSFASSADVRRTPTREWETSSNPLGSPNYINRRPSALSINTHVAEASPVVENVHPSASMIEQQLFRIKNLLFVRDQLTTYSEDSSDDVSNRSPVRKPSQSSGSVAFLASILGLQPRVQPAPSGSPPRISSTESSARSSFADISVSVGGSGATQTRVDFLQFTPRTLHDIRVRVDLELKRVCDEFLLDRVHACTQPLKGWMAKLTTSDFKGDDNHQGTGLWNSQDTLLQVYQRWHDEVAAELRITYMRALAYLTDTKTHGTLLKPIANSIVATYRQFYEKAMVLPGSGATTEGSEGHGRTQSQDSLILQAAIMTPEACAEWVNRAPQ